MTADELNEKLFDSMMEQAIVQNHTYYMASLPDDEELKSAHIFSAKFERKIAKLIEKSKQMEKLSRSPVMLKKTAAVFFAVIGLSVLTLSFSTTVQAAMREVVMQWFPQFSSYEFNGNSAAIKDAAWEFTYIPKGYEISAIHFTDGIAADWEYTNADDELLLIYTQKVSSGTILIDNEHSVYSQIELNGVTADLYVSNEADSASHLLWVKDGYSFNIMSYLEKDELIKIAESVKIIK